MKRVLITGATGFIGVHCTPLLKKMGYEIYAISSKPIESSPDIHWIQCDLLTTNSIDDLLQTIQPSHLLHFAWVTQPGKFWESLDNLSWLKASIDLIKAFGSQGGKRAVIAGTCAEYDWNGGIFSENEPFCNPKTLYGSSKFALFTILKSLAKQIGFSSAWGRIFYLHGPNEYPQRFVPSIIQGLLKKKTIPCSHCNQVKDFLHVEDAADAFVTLLESKIEGPVNIGSGDGVSLKEIIKKITQNIGGEELIQFGSIEASQNDPMSIIADTTRLAKELKWKASLSLDEGLSRTIDWWIKTQNLGQY